MLHVCPRYSTAYAESDYTDRDTDREEGEPDPEQESEDEEEDGSCATVLTLRQEDSQDEEVEEDRGLEEGEEEGDEGRLQQVTEVPSGELALLLAQSDILHTGGASLKAEGFRLLLDNRAEVRKTAPTHKWQKATAYSRKTIKALLLNIRNFLLLKEHIDIKELV